MNKKVAHSSQINHSGHYLRHQPSPNPTGNFTLYHQVDKLKAPVLKLAQDICRQSQNATTNK
jgi:hypothetical protein